MKNRFSRIFTTVILTMTLMAAAVMPVMADDILIAPAPEAVLPTATYELVINGEPSGINACVYVPVRATAEALGYIVDWEPVEKAVILDNGVMHAKFWVGVDSYQVSVSGGETLGMSAPFSLGMPPVVAKGLSYVPVALFEALEGMEEGAFTFEGNKLVIETKAAEEPAGLPAIGVAGGWTLADDMELTEEQKALFEKAMEKLLGVDYYPSYYLGSQVVAGTNHCFLCRAAVATVEQPTCYALVYIYEDLEGNASVLSIQDIEPSRLNEEGRTASDMAIDAPLPEMPGGWSLVQDDALTDETKAIFDAALEGLVGARHEPLYLLETQVVAGRNYCFLCRSTAVYPGARPYYTLVFVYQDLSGASTLLNIADFDFGALCEY